MLSLLGRRSGAGLEEHRAANPVMSHNPTGLDRLLYQASSGAARPTPAAGRQLVTKPASLAPDPLRVMPNADAEA
jgi:hypothetical protein